MVVQPPTSPRSEPGSPVSPMPTSREGAEPPEIWARRRLSASATTTEMRARNLAGSLSERELAVRKAEEAPSPPPGHDEALWGMLDPEDPLAFWDEEKGAIVQLSPAEKMVATVTGGKEHIERHRSKEDGSRLRAETSGYRTPQFGRLEEERKKLGRELTKEEVEELVEQKRKSRPAFLRIKAMSHPPHHRTH